MSWSTPPCSGTGTLSRNPEIKWRLKNVDIKEFSETQKRILQHASRAVRKNGRLIYCTCSILPAENDDVIRHFLANHSEFAVEIPSTPVPAILEDSRGFFEDLSPPS